LSKDDLICEGSMKITNLLVSGPQASSIDLYAKGKLIGKLMIETEFSLGVKRTRN